MRRTFTIVSLVAACLAASQALADVPQARSAPKPRAATSISRRVVEPAQPVSAVPRTAAESGARATPVAVRRHGAVIAESRADCGCGASHDEPTWSGHGGEFITYGGCPYDGCGGCRGALPISPCFVPRFLDGVNRVFDRLFAPCCQPARLGGRRLTLQDCWASRRACGGHVSHGCGCGGHAEFEMHEEHSGRPNGGASPSPSDEMLPIPSPMLDDQPPAPTAIRELFSSPASASAPPRQSRRVPARAESATRRAAPNKPKRVVPLEARSPAPLEDIVIPVSFEAPVGDLANPPAASTHSSESLAPAEKPAVRFLD